MRKQVRQVPSTGRHMRFEHAVEEIPQGYTAAYLINAELSDRAHKLLVDLCVAVSLSCVCRMKGVCTCWASFDVRYRMAIVLSSGGQKSSLESERVENPAVADHWMTSLLVLLFESRVRRFGGTFSAITKQLYTKDNDMGQLQET